MNDCEECDPKCDLCKAPITTGLMAMHCPMGKRCEFWPTDPEGDAFIRMMRGEPEQKLN